MREGGGGFGDGGMLGRQQLAAHVERATRGTPGLCSLPSEISTVPRPSSASAVMMWPALNFVVRDGDRFTIAFLGSA